MALVPIANLAVDPAVNEKLADFERNPSYERRVVAFYDYLGWKNHIEVAGEDPNKIGSLRRMILRHSRMLTVKKDLEVRASTFSDNMVITQVPGEKTQMLMQHLANVQLGAAINGFLVRGGITVGNICTTRRSSLVPGSIEPTLLESEVAKYPRIVLDPMVRKDSATSET